MSRKKTDRIYEWVFFAHSFLDIAKLGLNKLNKSKNSQKDLFAPELNNILIAVLWNFKHSMEIAVKSLTALSDEYYIHSHDQVDLLTDLANTLEKRKIPQPKNIAQFFPLFIKYYRLNIWNKKIIKNAVLSDTNNDLLRFPHNSARFELDIKEFKKINKSDLKDLAKDIDLFEDFLEYFSEKIEETKK